MIPGFINTMFIGASGVAIGQQVFTSSGSFVVPAGVTTISAVCVGGGGGEANGRGGDLRYSSSISVIGGETLAVNLTAGGVTEIKRGATVLLAARGGESGTSSTVGGNIGGGNGGASGTSDSLGGGGIAFKGGGGAGGYSGNGGKGGNGGTPGTNGVSGSGGGGGGGGGGSAPSSSSFTHGGNGGGVGLLGTGSNGTAGSAGNPGTAGGAGSGGSGRTYGGGGGSTGTASNSAQNGGCRIIWGPGRAYPSTNVADAS